MKFVAELSQSLVALGSNIFALLAGTTVALHLGLFRLTPWTIAAYPVILSARGVIGGLFSGRLSTGLHVGTVQPRFFQNTKSFYLLVQAIVVLTLETSVMMSIVATLFGILFWGLVVADLLSILGVITATMTLALVTVSPITLTVAYSTFRHGLNPDVVLYPVEATVSDILITLCYFLVLNLFFLSGLLGQYLVGFLGLLLLSFSVYILLKNRDKTEFVKTVRESFLMLAFVAFIVNVTGSFLGKIAEFWGSRGEIYTAYPALIDTVGSVGSVVGSTATTKLALGTLRSSFSAVKDHATEISSAWTASLIMFVAYSILSLAIQAKFTLVNFLEFTATLVVVNLMASAFIIAVAYVAAVFTYKKGLDPDNFVIPIESSLADSATTVSLLIALSLIG